MSDHYEMKIADLKEEIEVKETYTLAAESKIKLLEEQNKILKDALEDMLDSSQFCQTGYYSEAFVMKAKKTLKKCEEIE